MGYMNPKKRMTPKNDSPGAESGVYRKGKVMPVSAESDEKRSQPPDPKAKG